MRIWNSYGINPDILKGIPELKGGVVTPAVDVTVGGQRAGMVLSCGDINDIAEVAGL